MFPCLLKTNKSTHFPGSHECSAVLVSFVYDSMGARGGGRFGWQRQRPLLESKNRPTGESNTMADAAHSELWSGIRCVDPPRAETPQRTQRASKQNIFPPLSKPSNNRHFVNTHSLSRYSLRSLFLKRRGYIVLSRFTYCCIIK